MAKMNEDEVTRLANTALARGDNYESVLQTVNQRAGSEIFSEGAIQEGRIGVINEMVKGGLY